jgi:hypothetical protein
MIYDGGCMKLAILKARQLGFSTLLALIALDMILFNAGYTVGIVDQTVNDAEKKLEMVKFAFDNLPYDIRDAYTVVKRNGGELRLKMGLHEPESTVYGGTNSRGGTHQFLWISEWGPIQFKDAKRSDDIADGALPSAKEGIVVVETTWMGGKTGRLFTEIVEPGLNVSDEHRTKDDYSIKFFGWHGDESYILVGDYSQMPEKILNYFDELKTKYGLELTNSQKLWYYKNAWPKRNKRFEEYPSVLDEVFKTPVEGAVYADQMDEALTGGRIINYSVRKEPVYTFWDIGKRDLMIIVFAQRIGAEFRILDCVMLRGATLGESAAEVFKWETENKAIVQGNRLPHDGGWERLGKASNKSICQELADCGLRDVQAVPRIPLLSMGIEYVRELIPDMVFKADSLGRVYEFGTVRISFLEAMNNYRYAPLGLNSQQREPLHDINSHPVDALRTMAEAENHGMFPKSGGFREIEERQEKEVMTPLTDFEVY